MAIHHDEIERRASGLLYDVYNTGDPSWSKARRLLRKINLCATCDEARNLFESLLGKFPSSAAIVPPFYCDLGPQIELGENAFLNMDCLILDEAKVVIGDRTLIGPRCSFYTPVHPIDAKVRATGLEYARAIVIGKDVWMGGGCTINPGVTIGDESIIGSGSVVTRDIPSGVFAAGNPCRVIRVLGEEEKARSRKDYEEYLAFRKARAM